MTPKTPIEALFRAETLRLAHDQPFARRLLNSGRLSLPCSLEGFALQTPGKAPVAPGHAMIDAPLEGPDGQTWLVEKVHGDFTIVGFGGVVLPEVPGLRRIGVDQEGDYPCFTSTDGLATDRYGKGMAYLFRPDGHVAAVFSVVTAHDAETAMNRALGAQLLEAV